MNGPLRLKIIDENNPDDPMEQVLDHMRDRCSFLIDCYQNYRADDLVDQIAALQRDLNLAHEYAAHIGRGQP